MKVFHRKYDVNDLIHVVQDILIEYLGVNNVLTSDKFDQDLNMDVLTKQRIVLAVEHVLNYKLSNEDRDKINSIHDVLFYYKLSLDNDRKLNNVDLGVKNG